MVKQHKVIHHDASMTDQSKTNTAWQKDVDVEDLSHHYQHMKELGNILNKLKLSMAIFGLSYFKKENANNEKARKGVLPSIAAVYNICILLILWIMFFKYVTGWIVVEMDPKYTMLRIVPVTWGFQVAANATIMLKTSHPRFGNSEESCSIFTDKILPLIRELKVDVHSRNIKRHLIIVVIAGWAIVLFQTLFITFLLLYPYTSYATLLPKLVISPLPVNIYTRVAWIVIGFYMSAACILPMVYIIAVCIVMKFAFKTCFKAVEKVNTDVKENNVFPGCMYRQRILHLNTSNVIDIFDKDFKFFFANLCFTTIPISCFYMYQLFKTDMDSISTTVHASWLMFEFMSMTATCSYAAAMNKAAHSPLKCIYETGLKGVSLEQLGQVNFFVSKLTASPIGFSVLDFVVITKELILTVGGIFLTYSFVLLQL